MLVLQLAVEIGEDSVGRVLPALPRLLVVVDYLHHQRQRGILKSLESSTDTVTDFLIKAQHILSMVLCRYKFVTVGPVTVAPRESSRLLIALIRSVQDFV